MTKSALDKKLQDYIRTIPDFPHKGIMFRDITTLFQSAEGFSMAVKQMKEAVGEQKFDAIAGLEARGFVLGSALAYEMGLGVVMLRKAGKLPAQTIRQDYELEYGTASLEVHVDALKPGAHVLLIDDLIATGGTAIAGIQLIERLGAQVKKAGFIIDLPALGGRERIIQMGIDTHVLCEFDGH